MLVSDVIGMVQLAFVNEIKLRDISLGRESYSRIPILPSLSVTIHLTLAAVVISRGLTSLARFFQMKALWYRFNGIDWMNVR